MREQKKNVGCLFETTTPPPSVAKIPHVEFSTKKTVPKCDGMKTKVVNFKTSSRVCRFITWNNPKKIGETLHHQGTCYLSIFRGPIFSCNFRFLLGLTSSSCPKFYVAMKLPSAPPGFAIDRFLPIGPSTQRGRNDVLEVLKLHFSGIYGCGGLLKWWYPQIIHFNRVFHYKPSILGYPYFWGFLKWWYPPFWWVYPLLYGNNGSLEPIAHTTPKS